MMVMRGYNNRDVDNNNTDNGHGGVSDCDGGGRNGGGDSGGDGNDGADGSGGDDGDDEISFVVELIHV